MNRARRGAAVFFLSLAVALPAMALPARGWTGLRDGLFASLWTRVAIVLGLERDGAVQSSKADSQGTMDPDG